MGLFKFAENFVEGTLGVVVNTVKSGVGVVVSPLDDGEILEDGIEDLSNSIKKIGKSD